MSEDNEEEDQDDNDSGIDDNCNPAEQSICTLHQWLWQAECGLTQFLNH